MIESLANFPSRPLTSSREILLAEYKYRKKAKEKLPSLFVSPTVSSGRSMHATHRDAGRDFRGRALILEYVTALSALAFSLINSTRPPAWNRVSAATAQDTPCTFGIFIKGRRPYIPCRTSALLFVRAHPSGPIQRDVCTRDTCADNLNTADRCPARRPLDARPRRRKRVEPAIISRLRSRFAKGRLSIGWLFSFGTTS